VRIDLANLSYVALQKRVRHARGWLLWPLIDLLRVPAPATVGEQKRVILSDATRLTESGGCGDDWRVPLGSDLVAGRVLDGRITDRHTAEGLTLFDVRLGDLLAADRGDALPLRLVLALHQPPHHGLV